MSVPHHDNENVWEMKRRVEPERERERDRERRNRTFSIVIE